jgi:hypothetical protein
MRPRAIAHVIMERLVDITLYLTTLYHNITNEVTLLARAPGLPFVTVRGGGGCGVATT